MNKEELEKTIYIEDENIIVNVLYEYNIPLGNCKTHKDILRWADQIADKTWMTDELLHYFISVAHKANNLDLANS